MTNVEKWASELGWVIPESGDSCNCPKCNSIAFIQSGKKTRDGWGDIWVDVILTCPNCGVIKKAVMEDWTCKEDLISCLI